jgi:hypothetical protein
MQPPRFLHFKFTEYQATVTSQSFAHNGGWLIAELRKAFSQSRYFVNRRALPAKDYRKLGPVFGAPNENPIMASIPFHTGDLNRQLLHI